MVPARAKAHILLPMLLVTGVLGAILLALFKPTDWRWWLSAGLLACVSGAIWAAKEAAVLRADRAGQAGIAAAMSAVLLLGSVGISAHLIGGWPLWTAEALLEDHPDRALESYTEALGRAKQPGINMSLGWRLRLNRHGIVPADEAYLLVGMGLAQSRSGESGAAVDTLAVARELYIGEGRETDAQKVQEMIDKLQDSVD